MENGNPLRRLQEVQFALVELQLYLDMNPDDQRAVRSFAGSAQAVSWESRR